MTLKQLDNTNISKHLGKSSEYASKYDPTLLVRELRQSNRQYIDLDDDNLPFKGSDTWNGYEVTGLLDSGLPVSFIVKFVYPCESKYIVESKSVKLYFNSFSMTKLGKSVDHVMRTIRETTQEDLSKLLECNVSVGIFRETLISDALLSPTNEYLGDTDIISSPIILEEDYPLSNITITKYNEDPSLLVPIKAEYSTNTFYSRLLRSRCRVTSQPDSGDVMITIVGDKIPTPESLLRYIVSFRDECHFHEEICETIYTRLWRLLKPEQLSVVCLYARRGGWDINPERYSHEELKHYSLSDSGSFHIKTPKQ